MKRRATPKLGEGGGPPPPPRGPFLSRARVRLRCTAPRGPNIVVVPQPSGRNNDDRRTARLRGSPEDLRPATGRCLRRGREPLPAPVCGGRGGDLRRARRRVPVLRGDRLGRPRRRGGRGDPPAPARLPLVRGLIGAPPR